MSIDRCSKCGAVVDTDFDTEFYGEDGDGFGNWGSLCETCREEWEANKEAELEEGLSSV